MENTKSLFLTIDVGTTAIKVCAVDENFEVKICKKKEYQLCTDGSCVTLNPEIYWKVAGEKIREIVKEAGADRIIGITITTQGETMIPVDAQGKALYDAVVWLDGRAGEQAERIKELIDAKEFYQRTGVPECNELCPVSKLLWFAEKEPEVYAKAKYFLLLEDYMIFRLTGRMVTEKSLLSTTGYFDIHQDVVWDEILLKAGLEPDKIPPALDCGEIVSAISKEASEELGLQQNTVVVTGAMDQVCGAIGAGNSVPGMVTETTGTALCIGKTINSTAVNTDYAIPVYRHYTKNLQLLLPVCMTAGMALKWFKDTFCQQEAKEAEKTGRDVYDLLNVLAEASEPLAGGVVMLPYLAGSLQPYQKPGYRGGFMGVGLDSKKSDFVRALMEGVAYMLEENLLLLDKIGGGRRDYIVSMGGGSKSDIWCRIKADVTGMEVRTLKESETASIGAAMLCAKGMKNQALAESEKILKKSYYPDREKVVKYKEGFKTYNRILKQTIEVNN